MKKSDFISVDKYNQYLDLRELKKHYPIFIFCRSSMQGIYDIKCHVNMSPIKKGWEYLE